MHAAADKMSKAAIAVVAVVNDAATGAFAGADAVEPVVANGSHHMSPCTYKTMLSPSCCRVGVTRQERIPLFAWVEQRFHSIQHHGAEEGSDCVV